MRRFSSYTEPKSRTPFDSHAQTADRLEDVELPCRRPAHESTAQFAISGTNCIQLAF